MHRGSSNRQSLNLQHIPIDIEDTSYRSDYFVVSRLADTFTAGKNFFTINGSSLLNQNSAISMEISDSTGNPLFYEIAKSGYRTYSSLTDLVVSVHIYDTASSGFGRIILVGTDVNGKSVRWSTSVRIDPYSDNSNEVIFVNAPKFETSEFLSFMLNDGITSTAQTSTTIYGKVDCIAVSPVAYTDLDAFDYRKSQYDYRLRYTDKDDINNVPFSEQNISPEIEIHIDQISFFKNNKQLTEFVNITESVYATEVVNSNEVKLSSPIFYKVGGVKQVIPLTSVSFKQTFFNTNYITSSGLMSGVNPDGEPNPAVYLEKPVGASLVFVKESYLDVTYKNLKTLTGKIHRHKIYRKSLNKASEFENVADEPLLETELIFDKSTPNRSFSKIGEFYNLNHINRYFYTSSSDFFIGHDSLDKLNTLVFTSSLGNPSGTDYIILKNDSSIKTLDVKHLYIDYSDSQNSVKSGSAYDSNFIEFFKHSDYLISMDVDVEKLDTSKEAKISLYFTGSYNMPTAQDEIGYEENRGIRLHEYVLPIGTNVSSFEGKHSGKILSFSNDYIGTVCIVPVNIKRAGIRHLSLKTFAEFGFSPDVFTSRIVFPVSLKNEQFEIKSEFFDINSKSVYSGLRAIVNVDKNGETLFKNITNYLIADSDTVRSIISSGSLTISASRLGNGAGFGSSGNRAALSVVESFAVQGNSYLDETPFFVAERRMTSGHTYVKISGSLGLTGSFYIKDPESRMFATASWSEGVVTNADLTGPVTSLGNLTAITDGSISTAKLSTTTAGNIIVAAASGIPTYVAMSGDVTIGTTGVTVIGATKVTNAMMAGSIADSKLSTISTAGKVSNSATTAASVNTPSAIVARDGSGNFAAGTITATLTGTASRATVLDVSQTINGTNFDGSVPITVTAAGSTLTGTVVGSATSTSLSLDSQKVVGARGAAVASVTGATTGTATGGGYGFTSAAEMDDFVATMAEVKDKLNTLMGRFRATGGHGLIDD